PVSFTTSLHHGLVWSYHGRSCHAKGHDTGALRGPKVLPGNRHFGADSSSNRGEIVDDRSADLKSHWIAYLPQTVPDSDIIKIGANVDEGHPHLNLRVSP